MKDLVDNIKDKNYSDFKVEFKKRVQHAVMNKIDQRWKDMVNSYNKIFTNEKIFSDQKSIEKELKKNRFAEIQSGVYLYLQKEIIEEQKTWPEEDKAKNINFKKYDYWITTDSGTKPEGYDSLEKIYNEFNIK